MMSVRASDGPQGPQIECTGNYFRIGEVAEALSALGVAHTYDHQTDWRACLTVPVPRVRKAQEAQS